MKWPYVFIISRTRSVWQNSWVFVYELSGCGFESSCSHLFLIHFTSTSTKSNFLSLLHNQTILTKWHFLFYILSKSKKDIANHLTEENDSSAWNYFVLERKGFVFRKRLTSLTIFRRKKHLKSEFIQKMIIKYMQLSVAFITSRILIICIKCWRYNMERIVNIYPPSISGPLQSNARQHHVFLEGVYEMISKISEWLRRHWIATLYLFEINPQTSNKVTLCQNIFLRYPVHDSLNSQTEQICWLKLSINWMSVFILYLYLNIVASK